MNGYISSRLYCLTLKLGIFLVNGKERGMRSECVCVVCVCVDNVAFHIGHTKPFYISASFHSQPTTKNQPTFSSETRIIETEKAIPRLC